MAKMCDQLCMHENTELLHLRVLPLKTSILCCNPKYAKTRISCNMPLCRFHDILIILHNNVTWHIWGHTNGHEYNFCGLVEYWSNVLSMMNHVSCLLSLSAKLIKNAMFMWRLSFYIISRQRQCTLKVILPNNKKYHVNKTTFQTGRSFSFTVMPDLLHLLMQKRASVTIRWYWRQE